MPSSLGFYGWDYRSSIGLHRTSSTEQADTDGPLWDVFVGPLPFLLASSRSTPYLRETAPVSKQRMDTARDPGEVSLDSGIWLRGQTSWHLGAGQDYAEPLEGDADEARFRFASCGGVDPWTPGQLGMARASLLRGTGARRCVGVADGVVVSGSGGISRYPTSGSSTVLSTKTTVSLITASGSQWFGASSTGIEYGSLAGGAEGATALAGITALTWAKDRLWAAAGANLYEITNLAPPTLPGSPTASFRGGSVVAVAAGAAALYVMVVGAFTSIYAIVSDSTGTLSAPTEVATLPRGETGLMMNGYLGRYLAIGTSRGLRIADCSESSILPIGPVIVAATGGVVDAVGDGQYLYVTAGTERVTPDTVSLRPGLYRVDMSNPVNMRGNYGDTAASRFPWAPDLFVPGSGSVAGRAWSVTAFDGRIWYVAGADSADASLYRTDDSFSTTGWVDSGLISFSTAERKAWLSMGLEASGSGSVYIEADAGSGTGWSPVVSTVMSVPRSDSALAIDSSLLEPSPTLRHRIALTGDGTAAGSPTLASVSLRATPVPRRTRYIQLALMCFDYQIDRNNNAVGYEGWAYDVLSDLEALEERGILVTLLDKRTGEGRRCVIDKVSFNAETPPDKKFSGFGGVLTLTLLSV